MPAPRPLDPDVFEDEPYLVNYDTMGRVVRSTFWTDEKVGLLKTLWLAGVNTRLIAAKLGTTKNAVIGKACRIGLSEHVGRSRIYSEVPIRRAS